MSALAWFFLQIAFVAVPLLLLARLAQVYPRRPLAAIVALPAILSIGLVLWDQVLVAMLVVDGALVVLAVVDLVSLPRGRHLSAERTWARTASLGRRHAVSLRLAYQARGRLIVRVRDDLPAELLPDRRTFNIELAGPCVATLDYSLRPVRRGSFSLDVVHVVARSRFGLWQRYLRLRAPSVLHVYPDMHQLARYAILARRDRLSLLGLKRSRRIGQDNEFERLRDYTPDDQYKHIDWRSTARRGRLTVKDFQQNQSQRVVFLVDCGRMMVNQASGLSLLDHAFNSMLLLGHVALSHGDGVGLLNFSDTVHDYVPPKPGKRHLNRLLHSAFDRFPRLVESRYDQAFSYLAPRLRRRTLVVLITNLIDEVNAAQIRQNLRSVVKRHLPLVVLLRDARIFQPLDQPQPEGPALYRAAAAADILNWRLELLDQLRASGVLTLDVFPEQLTAPLVNRYLEVKARHLL